MALLTTTDTIYRLQPEAQKPDLHLLEERFDNLQERVADSILPEAFIISKLALVELYGAAAGLADLENFAVLIDDNAGVLYKNHDLGINDGSLIELAFLGAWLGALGHEELLQQIQASMDSKEYPPQLAYPFLWTLVTLEDDDEPLTHTHRSSLQLAQIVYFANTGRLAEATKMYDALVVDPGIYKPEQGGWVEFFDSVASEAVAVGQVQIYTNLWGVLALLSINRQEEARERLKELQRNTFFDVDTREWKTSAGPQARSELTETLLQIVIDTKLAKIENTTSQQHQTLPKTISFQ